MKFYRYWAASERNINDTKGHPVLVKKWGGSNNSEAEALKVSEEKLNKICERLLADPKFVRRKSTWGSYEYGLRDIPEEFIEALGEDDGITRNRYGCLVLNTSHALFVDIDFPPLSFKQQFGKLFGKTPDQARPAIDVLKTWLASHPGMGARVYRTAGGLRYLFTDAAYAPDAKVLTWLEELGSDKLYNRLCKMQECFRARLSPKPWRVEVNAPSSNYPRTGKAEASFRTWLSDYELNSKSYATCAFMEHVGNTRIAPALSALVARHDELTRANSTLPLA